MERSLFTSQEVSFAILGTFINSVDQFMNNFVLCSLNPLFWTYCGNLGPREIVDPPLDPPPSSLPGVLWTYGKHLSRSTWLMDAIAPLYLNKPKFNTCFIFRGLCAT